MVSCEKDVVILAIESSCDETAAAVVQNGREVLSNIISSQIAMHTLYGGVVPELASSKEKRYPVRPGVFDKRWTAHAPYLCVGNYP